MDYDKLQYEQYACVLASGQLSLDGLSRIVMHDESHEWDDSNALARRKVLEDAKNNIISVKKLEDEQGDLVYGVKWPLPLEFSDA